MSENQPRPMTQEELLEAAKIRVTSAINTFPKLRALIVDAGFENPNSVEFGTNDWLIMSVMVTCYMAGMVDASKQN